MDDPKAYTKPFMAQPGEFYKLSKNHLPMQLCIPTAADAYLQSIAGTVANTKAQK